MSDNLEETASALGEPAFHFTRKRRGEIAELAFMRKALSLGFGVAKPWGDSDHYDYILSRGHFFWRVQVKSAWRGPVYSLRTRASNGQPYTHAEIDFLVAYLAPEDLWYVFPISALVGRGNVHISIHSRNKLRWDEYREAWRLIRDCPQAHLCNPAVKLHPEVSEAMITEESPETVGHEMEREE